MLTRRALPFFSRHRRFTMVQGCLWFSLSTLSVISAGCKDLTGTPGLPAGTQDPSFYNTPTGAIGMRNTAMVAMAQVLPSFIADAGRLTDELESEHTGGNVVGGTQQNIGSVVDPLDERILREGIANPADVDYGGLQQIRSYATQAIGALAAYDTGKSTQGNPMVLRGELYAMEGYAEIFLADLFCSGVPLSTLDFQKDFTYHAGDSTAQVYRDALAKFDTALTLAGESPQILNLARVGRGRAWLDLGRYDSAAAAVASVPDDFQYHVDAQWAQSGVNVLQKGSVYGFSSIVSDHEGINGLPFLSAHDPRTAVTTTATTDPQTGNPLAIPWTFPQKYAVSLTDQTGFAPITIASGVEARLIQAEAALHAGVHAGTGTPWLTIVNRVRTSGTTTTIQVPDTVLDTLGYTGCSLATPCLDGGFAPGIDYAGLTLLTSTTVDIPDGPALDACRDIRDNHTPGFYWTCTPATVNTYADPTHTHSKLGWQAGTGGVNGLPPLTDPGTDPGTDPARVDLIFAERAAWLFLDGHRQGDLRRLIRQYHRNQAQVYPTGTYNAPGAGQYGTDVTAPIPQAESANPLFHGCLNRDA